MAAIACWLGLAAAKLLERSASEDVAISADGLTIELAHGLEQIRDWQIFLAPRQTVTLPSIEVVQPGIPTRASIQKAFSANRTKNAFVKADGYEP
jgi:hypothetical protein